MPTKVRVRVASKIGGGSAGSEDNGARLGATARGGAGNHSNGNGLGSADGPYNGNDDGEMISNSAKIDAFLRGRKSCNNTPKREHTISRHDASESESSSAEEATDGELNHHDDDAPIPKTYKYATRGAAMRAAAEALSSLNPNSPNKSPAFGEKKGPSTTTTSNKSTLSIPSKQALHDIAVRYNKQLNNRSPPVDESGLSIRHNWKEYYLQLQHYKISFAQNAEIPKGHILQRWIERQQKYYEFLTSREVGMLQKLGVQFTQLQSYDPVTGTKRYLDMSCGPPQWQLMGEEKLLSKTKVPSLDLNGWIRVVERTPVRWTVPEEQSVAVEKEEAKEPEAWGANILEKNEKNPWWKGLRTQPRRSARLSDKKSPNKAKEVTAGEAESIDRSLREISDEQRAEAKSSREERAKRRLDRFGELPDVSPKKKKKSPQKKSRPYETADTKESQDEPTQPATGNGVKLLDQPCTIMNGNLTTGSVTLQLPPLPTELGITLRFDPIFSYVEVVRVWQSSPILSQIPVEFRSASFITLIECETLIKGTTPVSVANCMEVISKARSGLVPTASSLKMVISFAKNPMSLYIPGEDPLHSITSIMSEERKLCNGPCGMEKPRDCYSASQWNIHLKQRQRFCLDCAKKPDASPAVKPPQVNAPTPKKKPPAVKPPKENPPTPKKKPHPAPKKKSPPKISQSAVQNSQMKLCHGLCQMKLPEKCFSHFEWHKEPLMQRICLLCAKCKKITPPKDEVGEKAFAGPHPMQDDHKECSQCRTRKSMGEYSIDEWHKYKSDNQAFVQRRCLECMEASVTKKKGNPPRATGYMHSLSTGSAVGVGCDTWLDRVRSHLTPKSVTLQLPPLPTQLGMTLRLDPIFSYVEVVQVLQSSPVLTQIPVELRSASFITSIECETLRLTTPISVEHCAQLLNAARSRPPPTSSSLKMVISFAKNPLSPHIPGENSLHSADPIVGEECKLEPKECKLCSGPCGMKKPKDSYSVSQWSSLQQQRFCLDCAKKPAKEGTKCTPLEPLEKYSAPKKKSPPNISQSSHPQMKLCNGPCQIKLPKNCFSFYEWYKEPPMQRVCLSCVKRKGFFGAHSMQHLKECSGCRTQKTMNHFSRNEWYKSDNQAFVQRHCLLCAVKNNNRMVEASSPKKNCSTPKVSGEFKRGCSRCKVPKTMKHFSARHARQWESASKVRMCTVCVKESKFEPLPDGCIIYTRLCSRCGKRKTEGHYSSSQWNESDCNMRMCVNCMRGPWA